MSTHKINSTGAHLWRVVENGNASRQLYDLKVNQEVTSSGERSGEYTRLTVPSGWTKTAWLTPLPPPVVVPPTNPPPADPPDDGDSPDYIIAGWNDGRRERYIHDSS